MLSFFSKKKHSPDTPPEEVIQGPNTQSNGADDFIFIEKKPTEPEPNQPTSMYPPMPPPSFGVAGLPYPGAYPQPAGKAHSNNTPVPYVQGVPFELSPQLCTKSAFELTQMQVDGILALMTRQMSIDDYNFALERSIQNESEY